MTHSINNFQEVAQKTIVAFHIGRGGCFYNGGHLTYLGEHKISKYVDELFLDYDVTDIVNRLKDEIEDWEEGDTDYDARAYLTNKDLFFKLLHEENWDELKKRYNVSKDECGEQEYFNGNGNAIGLTEKEAETGIGRINIDNEYDTTYTCLLSDCNENELKVIFDSSEFTWMGHDVQDYIKYMLNETEEEEA